MTASSRDLASIGRNGVLIALALLMVFGALRYDGFIGAYNLQSVVRYNSMFAFSGGIDLSVGSVAALSSVIAAHASQHGVIVAIVAPLLCAGVLGLINGLVVTRLRIAPFVATLAMLLAARGLALVAAGNESISVNSENGYTEIGQGDVFGRPVPGVLMVIAFVAGWIVLERSVFGRHVLAVGGNEEASRLLGVNVERTQVAVYTLSACVRVWRASSWPRSSVPVSRPRGSAGNCRPSPRSWWAAPCSPAAWARWAARWPVRCCSG